MKLEIKMNMDIDDNAREEVIKMLTHHIEWLMDLGEWTEIKTVYGVEVNPVSAEVNPTSIVKEIAKDLLEFYSDIDPYDTAPEIEENYTEIFSNTAEILVTEPGTIIEELREFADEDERAKDLIDRIERMNTRKEK